MRTYNRYYLRPEQHPGMRLAEDDVFLQPQQQTLCCDQLRVLDPPQTPPYAT